jgi:hypothetical protein
VHSGDPSFESSRDGDLFASSSVLHCQNSKSHEIATPFCSEWHLLNRVIGNVDEICDSNWHTGRAPPFAGTQTWAHWQPHNQCSIIKEVISFLDMKPQLIADDDNLVISHEKFV